MDQDDLVEALKMNQIKVKLYTILELQRVAESYFQHTESTFSSDTHQNMKRRIIVKHLTEPK